VNESINGFQGLDATALRARTDWNNGKIEGTISFFDFLIFIHSF